MAARHIRAGSHVDLSHRTNTRRRDLLALIGATAGGAVMW
jgi:hypothetical protein